MRTRRIVFATLLVVSLLANVVLAVRLVGGDWPWTLVFRAVSARPSPLTEADNKPFAYRMHMAVVEGISPVSEGEAAELPDEFVISPGAYRVFGKVYDLTREGAYRFVDPGKANVQRIVFEKDLDALLSGLAWAVSHGKADEKLGLDAQIAKARGAKLSLTCGPLSELALELLKRAGAKGRLVVTLTTDKWNTYDNGHSLVEVFRTEHDKYVAYDLDNNAYFTRKGGDEPLSALEVSESLAKGDYEIRFLANDTRLDVDGFASADGFRWVFLGEKVQADLRRWYGRVMQVVLLSDGGHLYFCDRPDAKRVMSYNPSFRPIGRAEFVRKFYSHSASAPAK